MRFGLAPFLMASAGIDMGGGGGDMAAVTGTSIDTSTDTGTGDSIDTGIDTDTTGSEPDGTGTSDTDTTAEPFKGRAIENGRINPAAKAVIDELAAKSPALAKQIKNALIRQDVFAREFPGGVQAVKAKIGALEGQIQELGGADGVKATKEELQFFHDLDSQFTAGDPRFIESLISAPEGKSAFLKLAPSMIEKYASMHPEGFDAFVAGKMKAEFEAVGLKTALSEMRFFLDRMADSPEKAEVLQRWAHIVGDNDGQSGLFNRTMARAARKPEAPKIEGADKQPQNDPREQQLNQREQTIKNQEYELTWKSELSSVFGPALAKLRTERGFDSTKEAAIKELFNARFDAVVKAKGQNATKFYRSGDKSGYQNAIRQLFRDEAPKTLAAVVDYFAPGKAGKKPTATAQPQRQSQNGVPVKAPVAEAGWTSLRAKPGLDQIDMDRTRALGPNAWGNGQAVLKDGKRVKFPR